MGKIAFNDYQRIRKMTFNEFNRWVEEFYRAAFADGYEVEKPQEMDLELVSIAIRSTEGIGEKLHARIMETINKLCFESEGDT